MASLLIEFQTSSTQTHPRQPRTPPRTRTPEPSPLWRQMPSSSSAPTPTAHRCFRHTPRCSRGSCRSNTASATMRGSCSMTTSGRWRSCFAIAASAPAPRCRRSCFDGTPASDAGSRFTVRLKSATAPSPSRRPRRPPALPRRASSRRHPLRRHQQCRRPRHRSATSSSSPRSGRPIDAADAERAVGRIVEMLRERRQYENATIVLVGDRGQTAGRFDEETLHVPLMVKQPQREGAGRYVDDPVQHIDVLPTILDLVRAPIPGGIKGRSLKSLLTDANGRVTPQPIYSEAVADAFRFGGNPLFALTLNDFRYVRSGVESLVRIGAPVAAAAPEATASADTSAEVPPLRATLDRLISGHPVPRASVVPARDRVMLALAGALPGLQQIEAESVLTQQQQQVIAAAHREAAMAVGERRLPVAVRTLQQIARNHPTLASVHYQIGLLSSELGRTQDAIAAFEAAAALRQDSPEVLAALALALAPAKPEEAQIQIDLAIEAAAILGPTEIAAAHDAAARIAVAQNDAEQADKH